MADAGQGGDMGGRGTKLLGGLLLLALLAGGVAWVQRVEILAWYYVHRLARATGEGRDRWVERVSGLGAVAVPGLLGCLRDGDPAACQNVRAGLARLSRQWNGSEATTELARRAAEEFSLLSALGQQTVLELAGGWLPSEGAAEPALLAACGRLLGAAATVSDPEVRARGLELCGILLGRDPGGETVGPCRDLVRAALQGGTPANRLRAIRLALRPGMDLLEPVVPLLNDPAAEVRRAAMLAVGLADQVVRDEGLLPSLHDPDAEVRRLCEAALRGRGLRPEHLKLGRLLTDPHPAERLKVLDHLVHMSDLDPGLWLRRLSHDPSPAVRVAALRVMSRQGEAGAAVDLSDRIDQMARNDPSPTVCKLAQYYLTRVRAVPAARTVHVEP